MLALSYFICYNKTENAYSYAICALKIVKFMYLFYKTFCEKDGNFYEKKSVMF